LAGCARQQGTLVRHERRTLVLRRDRAARVPGAAARSPIAGYERSRPHHNGRPNFPCDAFVPSDLCRQRAMDVGQNEAVQRTCPNSQRVAASQSTTATELGVPDAPHAKPGLAVLCPLCPGLLGIRETQPLHRHREVTDHLALGIGERDQELIDPDRVGPPRSCSSVKVGWFALTTVSVPTGLWSRRRMRGRSTRDGMPVASYAGGRIRGGTSDFMTCQTSSG
jgi:hypothetical protein